MKRFLIIVISAFMLVSSLNVAFADNDTEFNSPNRIGENVQLDVPLYQQEEDYTCGPACIRMALYKFGYDVTESSIAQATETNKADGTFVFKIKNVLNSYVGNNYENYETYNTSFDSKLLTSLRAGYPVICLVRPTALPNYKNQHVPDGHYVIVKGFVLQTGATTQITIQYNDPNYDDATFGSFTTTIPVMEQAIDANSGWYISKK